MSDEPGGLPDILVDTSVTRKAARFDALCEQARKANVRVYVSAITHGEMLRFLRETREDFSAEHVDRKLQFPGVAVLAVDENVAHAFASATSANYPSEENWNRAKQSHCLDMLGLGGRVQLCDLSANRHCSGTSDWFIAATAVAHGLRMVTEDTGPEFRICDTCSIEKALADLGSLTEDLP